MNLLFHGQDGDRNYYVPQVIVDPAARSTYLSTGSLQDMGITVNFPGDSLWCVLVDRSGAEICKGKRHKGQLYEMPISVMYPESSAYAAKCLSAQASSALHHALGHLRLAHINETDLRSMVKDGALKDITMADLKEPLFCHGCKVGKATNLPYTQPAREKVTLPGGRVHVDIWGPISTTGLRGERYMLVLVDEATQFLEVKLMKSKAETPQHIKTYKVTMEKQYDSFVLKILRSDNAREILLSKDMQEWMHSNGIVDEESPPYTPQLNGKAERAMRTIMEPVRSILAISKLRHALWSELVLAVVHIKNRLPSKAIRNQIPLELMTGKISSLTHLRVLGCDAYALFKAPGRNKLQQKANHYILVGYGVDAGTYRLYDTSTRKILVSRDVVFNEEGYIRAKYLPYRDYFGMGDVADQGEMSNDLQFLEDAEDASGNNSEDIDEDDDVWYDAPMNMPEEVVVDDMPLLEEESVPWGSDRDDDVDVSVDSESSEAPLTDPQFNSATVSMVIADISERVPTPKSFDEAMASPYADKWKEACQEEFNALIANKTWRLEDIPENHPILTGRWVFAAKVLSPTQVRFKARWVARGFNQQHGIDYNETFAPVMNGKSWHVLLALAAAMGLKVRNYDVSNAFLNGSLNEKVFVEQPHGFEQGSNKACELLKSLYGLKQAANVWYEKLVSVLTNLMGFLRIRSDSVVFVRGSDGTKVIMGGHVDDLLVMAYADNILDAFEAELAKHLKIKIGDMDLFLGVEIIQDSKSGSITIHQQRKIEPVDRSWNGKCKASEYTFTTKCVPIKGRLSKNSRGAKRN